MLHTKTLSQNIHKNNVEKTKQKKRQHLGEDSGNELDYGNPETADFALAGVSAGPGTAERCGLAGREPYKVQDPMEAWLTTGRTDG